MNVVPPDKTRTVLICDYILHCTRAAGISGHFVIKSFLGAIGYKLFSVYNITFFNRVYLLLLDKIIIYNKFTPCDLAWEGVASKDQKATSL